MLCGYLYLQISVLRLATHTYQDDQDLEEHQVREWVGDRG